jgi:hypothetical protein
VLWLTKNYILRLGFRNCPQGLRPESIESRSNMGDTRFNPNSEVEGLRFNNSAVFPVRISPCHGRGASAVAPDISFGLGLLVTILLCRSLLIIFVEQSYERSLRTAVQWRKISFGDRGHKGEMAVAVCRPCPQLFGSTMTNRCAFSFVSINFTACGQRCRLQCNQHFQDLALKYRFIDCEYIGIRAANRWG